MTRIPRLALGILSLALAVSAAPAPAAAQAVTAIDQLPGITCTGGFPDTCGVEFAPGLRVEGPRTGFTVHADARGFDLMTPEHMLSARLCDPGAGGGFCLETLYGGTRLQVPRAGFLAGFITEQPPLSQVGLDTGANLVARDAAFSDVLLAAMVPDERYLVYHTLTGGIEAGIPGLDFAKLSSGGETTTVVIGTDSPFFYFEGELPNFPFGSKKKAQDDGSGSDPDAGGATSDPNATTDPNAPSDPAETPDEGGTRAVVAVDSNGRLPFVPVRTRGVEGFLPAFDGHLYVRGPIPVNALLELDGTAVMDVDPDGDGDHPFEATFYTSFDLELGGNGVLQVALPIEWLSLPGMDLTLGEASVGTRVSESEDRAAFTGIVSSRNFLTGLPIPIRPGGSVEAWGRISDNDPLGSFVHGEGDVSVDASVLGQLLGLPLGDLVSQHGVFDISAAGFVLQGDTASRIHPDIAYSGGVGFTVAIGTDGSFLLELRGDMVVAGEGLENGVVRITQDGMTVEGTWISGQTRFLMTGAFLAGGYRLSGSATAADPIALNAQETVRAANALLSEEQNRDAIAAAVQVARDEVARYQTLVNDALAAVAAAQSAVDSIQSGINYYTSLKNSAYSSYRYWVNKSCKWYDAVCQSKRAANISYYWSKYTYYQSVLSGMYVSKAAADATLAAARSALTPVQTQLANAQSALALLQSQLDAAAAAVAQAQAYLDTLPDVNGTLVPVVTATLENGGVSAGVEATWNGQPLTGGTVDLATGRVCIDVPTAGTLCSSL